MTYQRRLTEEKKVQVRAADVLGIPIARFVTRWKSTSCRDHHSALSIRHAALGRGKTPVSYQGIAL